MLSESDACEYWRSHESEKRSFELEAVERTVKNQTTVKREELASMVDSELDTNTFNESLILAQDERWRRA